MRTTNGWASLVVIAAVTILRAATATADTAQEEAAEMRFQEAKALMERGNFGAACPKLIESQRLDPAVGTLLYLGECYDRNGQTATAWTTFLAAADAAHSASQLEREKMARDRANALSAKVSKVIIAVAPKARIPGLEVKLDGAVVSEVSWGFATPLDPGKHKLEAVAPDRKLWFSRITIAPNGDQTTIDVPVLEPKTAINSPPVPIQMFPLQNRDRSDWSPAGAVPPLGPKADSHSSDGSTHRLIAFTASGVGIAGFAVGTIFGLVAKSKESNSEQYCSAKDNTSCQHPGVAMINEAKRDATIANVGFVVGGLGLVTGAVLYLTAPQPNASKSATRTSALRIAPLLAPTAAGFAVAGQY